MDGTIVGYPSFFTKRSDMERKKKIRVTVDAAGVFNEERRGGGYHPLQSNNKYDSAQRKRTLSENPQERAEGGLKELH